MNKIKRVSVFFRMLFQFLFVISPIFLVLGWMHAPDPLVMFIGFVNLDFIPPAYHDKILHVLTPMDKLLGFSVSAIPAAIGLYILYAFIKLFKLYENGEIFSINNVRYIRHIGYALLAKELFDPFYQAFMGVVLTWHNPHGHRFASVTLDQTDFGMIVVAILVILISWIMAEGCRLREEQQLTI